MTTEQHCNQYHIITIDRIFLDDRNLFCSPIVYAACRLRGYMIIVTVYSECTHVYTVLTTINMIAKKNTVKNCMNCMLIQGECK